MRTPIGRVKIKANEECCSRERRRIEEEYILAVPRFDRVFLSADREAFDEGFKHFEQDLNIPHQTVLADFEGRLINEFSLDAASIRQ